MTDLQTKLNKLSKRIVKNRLKLDKSTKKSFEFYAKGKKFKVEYEPLFKRVLYSCDVGEGYRPIVDSENIIAIGANQEEILKFMGIK